MRLLLLLLADGLSCKEHAASLPHAVKNAGLASLSRQIVCRLLCKPWAMRAS